MAEVKKRGRPPKKKDELVELKNEKIQRYFYGKKDIFYTFFLAYFIYIVVYFFPLGKNCNGFLRRQRGT